MNKITLKESPETFIDRRNMPYIPGQEIIITQKSKTMKTQKTAMRDTSLDAYDSIRDELSRRQFQVFEVLGKVGVMSNRQLSVELGLPINQITGRTRELIKAGQIYEYDKVKDLITGRTVIRWAVIPVGKQLEIY